MIYLLYGDEQFLLQQEVACILAKYPNTSIEKLEGPKLSYVVEIASMPSLFSPQRVFILIDLDLSEDDDAFESFLSNLPQGVAIIIKNPLNLNKKTNIYKVIEEKGTILEFRRISEWEEDKVRDFIEKKFLKLNKKIAKDNASFIIENVGTDLMLLNSEIGKIATYVGEKTSINKSDIEAVIISSNINSFKLLDSIFKKNKEKSMAMLNSLLQNGEEPIVLLSFLASQYRALLKIKILSMEKLNFQQIAQKLRVSSYYVKRMLVNAKEFSVSYLKSCLEMMYYTDIKLKSGYNYKIELPMLLMDLL